MIAQYSLVPVGRHHAPYLPITLFPVAGPGQFDTVGLLDTGAERSVIPHSLVSQLGLVQVGARRFEGVGGFEFEMPLFQLLLAIGPFPAEFVTAAADESEDLPLIGRDVMETFRILLDGPAQTLRIEQ